MCRVGVTDTAALPPAFTDERPNCFTAELWAQTPVTLSYNMFCTRNLSYLNEAQRHEGQTDTEDEHPSFLHRGLQLLLMAASPFLSALLYLQAFHDVESDNCI